MLILAIETSCDDTAIAVVEDGKTILANLVASQNDIHLAYGGIVPEIASRKHLETILPLLDEVLKQSQIRLDKLDAIAVTTHPGLIGSLATGVNTAKTLSYQLNLPLIPVNHLHAHFYSLPMSTNISYPFIGLLVSGGHTLLAKCTSPSDVAIIGSTLDDACGECFDKIAKYFNLGYPGGPIIDRLAQSGNPNYFLYPVTKIKAERKSDQYHFSYSGLKTAVIHQSHNYLNPEINSKKLLINQDGIKKIDWPQVKMEDLAASFQQAALKTLLHQTTNACRDFNLDQVGVCGGVSANRGLRTLFQQSPINAHFPDFKLCTDNAAMIGGLAYHLFNRSFSKATMLKVRPSAKSIRGVKVKK